MHSAPENSNRSPLEPSDSKSAPPQSSSRPLEQCEFHIAHSESLPTILEKLKSSLLITTYRTGNLVSISQSEGRIACSFHAFDRPMGLAVKENGMAIGTRNQIWFLRSAPDIARKLEGRDARYDTSFFVRHSHFTGDIHCHDIAWVGNELWIVNTLFSCLCTLNPSYHFAPRWHPPFVSRLAPEDRCHLNGLAAADGCARFATAMAESDSPRGWRDIKANAGCVIDVASSATVSRGLTMPHSPRLSEGKLYVLNSGLGRLELVEPASGHRTPICELPGYARGLAIVGSLAFVGLSKIRPASDWSGVPIARDPERLKCGVWVVDLQSGTVHGSFEFRSGAEELFDVQALPGSTKPFLSGPNETNPVWTVKPRV